MYEMNKKESLVAAAKTLLTAHGYHAVSPRRIQTAAGAGQGSFYHHFSGKLDLAAAALHEVAAAMCAEFDAAIAGTDGLDAACTFLEMPRDGLAGCGLGRLAQESAILEPALRDPVETYFTHVESSLGDLLGEAQSSGELRFEASPSDLAAALVAIVQGGYVLARVHQEAAAMERALRGALSLLAAAANQEP